MAQSRQDIAEKRAKRIKAAKIRRLKFLLVVFLVIAFIVMAVLSVTVLFPIKKIDASGSNKYSSQTIIEASGLEGENLIAVSEKRLLEKIRKKLPYVDNIKIKKDMPDKISLKIVDAKVYAAYRIENEYYLVSKKGYVLEKSKSCPKKTFEVISKVQKTQLGELLKFADKKNDELTHNLINYLEDRNIKINMINVKNKLNITAKIEDRFDVLLGSEINLERKCAHLATMLKKIEKDAKGTINLSMWTPENPEGTLVRKTKEEIAARLLKLLNDEKINVDKIDTSDGLNIVATVEKSFTVKFGEDIYLAEKCSYLVDVLEGLTQGGTIDLSKWTPNNHEIYFHKKD